MKVSEKKRISEIEQVGYRPPSEHQLDIEVFTVAELKRRVGDSLFHAAHRIEFYLLIFITRGTCTHTVDFSPVCCDEGTLLILRPAQAHKFDTESDWDGWVIIFRPEFLLPLQPVGSSSDIKLAIDLDSFSEVLKLTHTQSQVLAASFSQMQSDSMLHASAGDLHTLLRHQLYSQLLRLQIFHSQDGPNNNLATASMVRFKRFQQLVEKNFSKWHQVSDYSKVIGCSEKSLTRAVSEVTGSAAKALITSRINLEAKRLLAYTALPVALISDRIGFDEVTNFIKFFKREVGCSPGSFRRQYTRAVTDFKPPPIQLLPLPSNPLI